MVKAYENLISRIEEHEVNRQTDTLLQRLGEEMVHKTMGRPAFRDAVRYVVREPATDPSHAARFHRLAHLSGLSEHELNAKVEMLIDTVFEQIGMDEILMRASA